MRYVLTNANLLDGRLDQDGKMPVKTGAAVAVDGDKIVGVYEDGNYNKADYADYKVIDLGGKYLMPGLINMHVHLMSGGEAPKAASEAQKDYKAVFKARIADEEARENTRKIELNRLKNHLYSGVTTLRMVGDLHGGIDIACRDMINNGEAEGPRVLTCGEAISVPGGHMAGAVATESATVEQAIEDLGRIIDGGADWVKLMITGGVMDAVKVGEPGALRMQPEMVKAVCDEAHRRGYKTCAHVESPEGVRVALENGVDTIEHGSKLDDHMIQLFKEHGAAHTCTISPAFPYAIMKEDVTHCGDICRVNGAVVMDGIIECARACLDNGIPVGLGTDAGCNFITPYDMWRELDYFEKYDKVSADFALHSATQVNAEILGLEDEIGTVETGKSADMMVTDENPLDDFGHMRNPAMVVARGEIIDRPQIDRLDDVDQYLDEARPGSDCTERLQDVLDTLKNFQ